MIQKIKNLISCSFIIFTYTQIYKKNKNPEFLFRMYKRKFTNRSFLRSIDFLKLGIIRINRTKILYRSRKKGVRILPHIYPSKKSKFNIGSSSAKLKNRGKDEFK